jgi:hypothetical protein
MQSSAGNRRRWRRLPKATPTSVALRKQETHSRLHSAFNVERILRASTAPAGIADSRTSTSSGFPSRNRRIRTPSLSDSPERVPRVRSPEMNSMSPVMPTRRQMGGS